MWTSHHIWNTAVHTLRTNHSPHVKHCSAHSTHKPFTTCEALQCTLYAQTIHHMWSTAVHTLRTNHSPHVKHCSIQCMHSNAQTVHHCSTTWDCALSCYQSKERKGRGVGGGGLGLRKGNSKQKENVLTDLLVRFSFGVPCVHGGCDATGQIGLVACLAVLQHLTKVVQLTGTLSNTSLTNKNYCLVAELDHYNWSADFWINREYQPFWKVCYHGIMPGFKI